MVVFYPPPDLHFQAIGCDSIEQATSSSREQRTRAKTERVSGRLGRPRPGHLASLSGAHSHVSSAKHVCVLEARNAGERRWNERSQHSYHFFSFLIIAIITGIPRGSLCGGERRGARERETRKVRSLRFSALCWLASLTARRE